MPPQLVGKTESQPTVRAHQPRPWTAWVPHIFFGRRDWDEQVLKMLAPDYFLRIPDPRRYAAAVLITALTTATRVALIPWLGTVAPYYVNVIAVAVATVLLGLGPGLVTVVLSMAAAEAFVVGDLESLLTATGLLRLVSAFATFALLAWMLHTVRVGATRARESEARLRVFAEASFEGIVESEQGRILDCNQQFAELAGRTAAELKGTLVADLIAPEDRQHVLENIIGNQESLVEHGMIRNDGTRLVVEAHGRPTIPGSTRRHTAVRDVTPRKQAEETLRQVNGRLQFHLQNTPLGVVDFDSDLRVSAWSPGAERIFGWAASEVLGRGMWEVPWISEADRNKVQTVAAELQTGGTPRSISPNRNLRRDGTEIWCEWYNSALTDPSGKMQSIQSLVLEVTARRRAEEALRVSEEFNRSLVDNTSAIILRVDPQARITFANPRALEFFGYSEEELIGKPAVGTIIPETESTGRDLARMVREIAESPDRFHSNTNENMRRDGERVWLEWTNSGIYGAAGRLQEFLSVGIDITDRRRAQEALRESEDRFRIMADGTPLPIWVTNAQGGLRFFNRACREFYGVTNEAVQDFRWEPLLHPEDQVAYVDAFLAAIRDRKSFRVQARVRRHDGAWRWIDSYAEPRFSPGGEFLGMSGSSPDITERKEFQTELERLVAERTAKLRDLVGELEHFSYTITHDMRAPLRAMRGFGELVCDLCDKCEHQERKEFIRRIITSAERMDALIRDALNYSRSVTNELPLDEVDTGKLLRGMLDTYPELQPSKAHIRVEGRLPVVLANEAGMTQCFSNLLGNAVKFVKPGEVPHITVRAEEHGHFARLWIEDRGIGIARSMLPRVFDMFSRGHRGYEGTGIGLALVRKVVHRMGGRVGVESAEGQGSRFWLELKISERPHRLEKSTRTRLSERGDTAQY